MAKNKILNPDHSACFVCGVRFKTSIPPGPAHCEEHHVMPRNAGGTDGPLVRICDTHHSGLHKIAERMHRRADYKDLLAGEAPASVPRLLWLASAVVKSEQAVEGDPNKKFQNSVKLSIEDIAMLDQLKRAYPNKGRSEILRAGLFLLYQATFKKAPRG